MQNRNSVQEMNQLVEGFYLSRLQEVLSLSEEQHAKAIPLVKKIVQVRRSYSQTRGKIASQIRKLLAEDPPSEIELKIQLDELRKINLEYYRELQNAQDDLDSILSIKQQAQFRIYLQQTDQQLRRMLDRIRKKPANQQPATSQP